MNYYNPYYSMMPYGNMLASAASKPGLFSSLLGGVKGMNWGSIITNTQRTLGIVNQAIPVIKQVTPIAKNAKTMFRVMNEFKKSDEPVPSNKNINNQNAYSNNTSINQDTNSRQNVNTTNNSMTSTNTPSELTFSNNNEPTFFI